MKNIKVLWFSNTPAAGDEFISSNGTGGWLKSLDKAIQDKLELHVAFYNRNYPSVFRVGSTTYHQLSSYSKIDLIKRRIQFKIGLNPDLNRWLKLIDEVNPDIIHIHGTEKPWIQVAKYTNLPIILSIQAILTVMNYKYFTGIKEKDLGFNSKYLISYKKFLKAGIIERENLRYIKYVLGRTDWDRRVYSVLAPKAKYFVSNEVLREGFYKIEWKKPNRSDGKIIVHTTTGTLLFKGLETICESASELEKLGIDFEWRIAGIAEKNEINCAIKRKMGSRYPRKSIVLLGSLKEDLLLQKMLEAHIYVNASHQDNSPNSLCEAMLIGMPCIATCAGGSNTILKDGINGILLQDGDPWSMAGAILELINNPAMAEQYAKSARDEALNRHNKKEIVENLLSIYQYVINEKS